MRTSNQQLQRDLGKALTPKDVAAYLGLNEKTVRRYYRELGGVRLGRIFRFFEKEFIYAVQTSGQMDRSSEETRGEARKSFFMQEGGSCMGSQDEAETRRRLARNDSHNLFG